MKDFKLILLIGLIVIVSCNKEDDFPKKSSGIKSEESYKNDNGIVLDLISQKWFLEENEIGGVNVRVNILGTIIGDSATITAI